MSRFLIVDVDKCTGCRICELVCSMTIYEEYNPSKSHIRLLRNKELDVNIPVLSVKCNDNECGECVRFCPTNCLKFISSKEAALMRKNMKIGIIPAPLTP